MTQVGVQFTQSSRFGGSNEKGYPSNPINCVKPIISIEQGSLFIYGVVFTLKRTGFLIHLFSSFQFSSST